MRESVCPPQRMRYSLESRRRIVRLILAGASPQAAAAARLDRTGVRSLRRGGSGALDFRLPRATIAVDFGTPA